MKKNSLIGVGLISLIGLLVLRLWLCNESPQLPAAFPAPNWLGVIPGQTTEPEIIQQFGKPDRSTCGGYYRASLDWLDEIELTRWCFCGQTVHHYALYDAYIYMRAGKVWEIKTSSLSFAEELYLSDFINRYGKPDKVAWSRADSSDRIVIYPRQGLLLSVRIGPDITRAGISGVIYFAPMPFDQVLQTFRNELSLDPEYLYGRKVFDLIPGPMDPWGFNN